MKRHLSTRSCIAAAALAVATAIPLVAQVEILRPREGVLLAQNGTQEEHLQRWMQSHSAMSLADQQRALQNEPGFRELPAQVQQNRLNMLARLYNMNPQQRSRILSRTEVLERMAPAQRQQWRDAVQRLNSTPQPRRRMIANAILGLRELPPEQREAMLNSPAYASQFSPDERQTLHTLLTAEPYPQPPGPQPPPAQ